MLAGARSNASGDSAAYGTGAFDRQRCLATDELIEIDRKGLEATKIEAVGRAFT